MRFDYQLKRDFEEPSQESIIIARLLGIFFISTGVIALFEIKLDESKFKILLFSIQILYGLFQLFFPKLASKIFVLNDETIDIDDNRITWKLDKNQPMSSLDFSSIKKIEIYSGEVRFETFSGENHKLSSHQIRSKTKFEEFNRIIGVLKSELRKN